MGCAMPKHVVTEMQRENTELTTEDGRVEAGTGYIAAVETQRSSSEGPCIGQARGRGHWDGGDWQALAVAM